METSTSKKNILRQILHYRVHGFVASILLCSLFLFSAFQVGIKAAGNKVIAGRITSQYPMSLCTQYQYNICRICSQCGCGQWDEDSISLDFGRTSNSATYICKQSSYQGQGQGNFQVNTIVFGMCGSETLSTYDPQSCNVWSVQGSAAGKIISHIARLLMEKDENGNPIVADKAITLK